MLYIKDIKLPLSSGENEAVSRAIEILKVNKTDIKKAMVSKLSVDARKGRQNFVFTVAVQLTDEKKEQALDAVASNVSFKKQTDFSVVKGKEKMISRPIVCGFGPAGMFAALLLAKNGYRPIVLERGEEMEKRAKTVEGFEKSKILNTQSNIQFGEGGAGAFSDGKLTTRIGDELCGFVTKTFLSHGAPAEIEYLQKPHIGTDILRDVIVSIRKEIIALGGEILFNTQLLNLKINNGKLVGVVTQNGEIPCDNLVLATGHSARDTFFMLDENGVEMQSKPFSVGFRVEHLQGDIDKALYHENAGNKALPKGEYQLNSHIAGRGVYTFCNCPGGLVVCGASEENSLCTNGMSYHSRDGKNANSAVVVGVEPTDFENDFKKAIAFQRELEQKAFTMGGGDYKAPCQNVNAFLTGTKAPITGKVVPSYAQGVTEANIALAFPSHLTTALQAGLRDFARKINCFNGEDALITGLETRTSSPVRIMRNDGFESVNVKGIYPTGEGAGYAGGIMSAAVDGLRVAKTIIEKYGV